MRSNWALYSHLIAQLRIAFLLGISALVGLPALSPTGAQPKVSLVRDINPGPEDSGSRAITQVGDAVYFVANDEGVSGVLQLFVSDGTRIGTQPVKAAAEVSPGIIDVLMEDEIVPTPYVTEVAGNAFFSWGGELGFSDGTPGGTIQPNSRLIHDRNVRSIADVAGRAFFAAEDGEHGRELWVSDGTDGGTEMVADIYPGQSGLEPNGSGPRNITGIGGTAFFSASDGEHGRELWKSGGGDAQLVADINSGSESSFPLGLTEVGSSAFFRANDGEHGPELWVSDGTTAGTHMVKDLNPGLGGSDVKEITEVDGKAFFAAEDENAPGLWISDGTSEGTRMVKAVEPAGITAVGEKVFFAGEDEEHGTELWKSDGTANGTKMVADINPGYNSSEPHGLTEVNGAVYFSARDEDHGEELWVSDGTAEGTRRVEDINPGTGDSSPERITEVGKEAFFVADDGEHGAELWKTGTAPKGSRPVARFTAPVIPEADSTASTVMEGGSFARYYRITNGEGQLYTKPGKVAVLFGADSSALVDGSGLVRLSGATDQAPFSEVNEVPATVSYAPVDSVFVGFQRAKLMDPPQFEVQVQEREWARTWEQSSGLGAQAAFVFGLRGEKTGTVALTKDQARSLKIGATFEEGLGALVTGTAFELGFGVGSIGCGGGAQATFLRGTGSTYRFEDPFGEMGAPEAAGLVLLSALAQQRLQTKADAVSDFLKDLVQELSAALGVGAFSSQSTATTGFEAGVSAGCQASLGKKLSDGEVESSAGFSLAGVSVNLGGGISAFHRELGPGQFVNARETGFEAFVTFEPTVRLLVSLLKAFGVKESVSATRTVSMKAIRETTGSEKELKQIVSSLGSQERTMRLILERSELEKVASHVGQEDPISPIIKEFNQRLQGRVIDWTVDWEGGTREESLKNMQQRLYNQLLEALRELSGEARAEYEVVRTETTTSQEVQVPLSLALGGLDLGLTRSEAFHARKKWTKERGVIYCPEAPSESGSVCKYQKRPSQGRTAIYWTERYEKDKRLEDEGRTLFGILEELMGSLAPDVEALSGEAYEYAETTLESGRDATVEAGAATVEFGGDAVESGADVTATLVGWNGADTRQKVAKVRRAQVGGAVEDAMEFRPVGRSHQLFPKGTELEAPATLTIGYSEDSLAAGTEEKALDIYRFDRQKGRWVATGGTVDADSNEVETSVSTFTTYAIAGDRAPPAPPRLETEPDTTGQGRVRLDWAPSEASDLAGYHVYRSDSTAGDYTQLTESLHTATTFTDESAHPDSTHFYAVTAVDAARNESPRFGKVGGSLRTTEAAASAEVYAEETVGFGKTGVDLRFTGLVGAGQVTVTKRTGPPAGPTGIDQPNVSSYRLVTEAETGLSLTSGVEVRLDTSRLAGLEDPTNVTAYGRGSVGSGRFADLPTAFDSTAGELVAQTGRFGELVLASGSEPLPVEMATFEARLDEGQVRLRWQTASETNNAGFYVRRRAEAGAWTQVGFIESKAQGGTSTEPLSYRFRDADLPYTADSLTYRIRQVDTDGSAHLYGPVTVRRGAPERAELQAPFPNPVRRQATVRLALPERQEVTLRLYDVLGRQVVTVKDGPMEAGRTQLQLDTSRLSSGMYFLRLQAEGTTRTRKLTVVR